MQHGVLDVGAMVAFVTNWSRLFRGLGLDPTPDHCRIAVARLPLDPEAEVARERGPPAGFKMRVLPPGETFAPEFLPVMYCTVRSTLRTCRGHACLPCLCFCTY